MGTPLPRDPIADAQRNWERHGWGDVVPPAEFAGAIAAGVLLWLAAVHLVGHELRTEIRIVAGGALRKLRR